MHTSSFSCNEYLNVHCICICALISCSWSTVYICLFIIPNVFLLSYRVFVLDDCVYSAKWLVSSALKARICAACFMWVGDHQCGWPHKWEMLSFASNILECSMWKPRIEVNKLFYQQSRGSRNYVLMCVPITQLRFSTKQKPGYVHVANSLQRKPLKYKCSNAIL